MNPVTPHMVPGDCGMAEGNPDTPRLAAEPNVVPTGMLESAPANFIWVDGMLVQQVESSDEEV